MRIRWSCTTFVLLFYQNWSIDLGGVALTRTHGRTEGRTCAKQITPHYSDECINEYINQLINK